MMTWKMMKHNNTVNVCCKDGEWLWNDDDNYSHDDFVVVEGMSIGRRATMWMMSGRARNNG